MAAGRENQEVKVTKDLASQVSDAVRKGGVPGIVRCLL